MSGNDAATLPEQAHETVDRLLRRTRQRYTGSRRELVELLAAVGRPLTIAEILERRKELAQSSVYRNLQVLEHAGAVRRVLTPNDPGARYELAEDLTTHHHHLICSNCGTVEDFEPSPAVERALEAASREAGDEGFDADQHRLDLVGTCAGCR